MHALSRVLVLVAALLAPGLAAAADTLVVVTDDARHEFTIEIADDPMERAQGLMFREEMAPDHGMLFDFAREQPASFWMKNTPLSLDMIFAKADGTIVRIAEDTTPFSTDSVPSGEPVRFVFEVLAGTSDRLDIEPGDRIEHPRVEAAE
ncbi:DUF192 domain-containing protein [Amorphus orientalis]|uniref:Uncharacterized membrane protein (UPF0127 family) n=1 Tax=Amorphus orientalis TaxID=649198 RepID=A0AAE3VQF8_9HYPH|nr:DUF192 domain-containing protein [Amorphus orientalis]MDQ0316429.1 uncharacterized membrane protein (UPF0127 family) [Amorphus orientalis]